MQALKGIWYCMFCIEQRNKDQSSDAYS